MRGKAARTLIHNDIIGITPAYAGKSLIPVFFGGRFEDHPRLCGEKCFASLFMVSSSGSPPPMRGKAPPFYY